MNKQELIEMLKKRLATGIAYDTSFAGTLKFAIELAEELDEPGIEECEIVETERNDYVSDFQCSKCKVCFDLFKWVYAPNTKVNYCPNCGAKIKREKRDE